MQPYKLIFNHWTIVTTLFSLSYLTTLQQKVNKHCFWLDKLILFSISTVLYSTDIIPHCSYANNISLPQTFTNMRCWPDVDDANGCWCHWMSLRSDVTRCHQALLMSPSVIDVTKHYRCHQVSLMSPDVTKCHQMSPSVTGCHQMSQTVTRCH